MIVGLIAFFWCAISYSAPMTLEQSIHYGIEHSPELQSSRQAAYIKRMEKKNVLAEFLPSLSVSNELGLTGAEPSTTTTDRSSRLSLTLSEKLYDNHQNINQLKIAQLESDTAETQYEIARDQLILDILTAFYAFSLEKRSLEIQNEKMKRIQVQLRLIEEQYRQGRKTRVDYLRTRGRVQRAAVDIQKSQEAIANKQRELNNKLGVPANEAGFEYIPMTVPKKTSIQIPADAISFQGTRQYTNIERAIRKQDINVYLAQRSFWPQITVSGGATYSFDDYHNGGPTLASAVGGRGGTIAWSAVVKLEFTVWDWFTQWRNVDIAKANRIIENNRQFVETQELHTDLSNLQTRLKRLQAEFGLSLESFEIEKESFEFITSEYRKGKVSFLDMITALDDFSQAEINLNSAYFDLMENLNRVEFFQGKLYERFKSK